MPSLRRLPPILLKRAKPVPARNITNADLYTQIGALSANVERLIDDSKEANIGRQKLYERIDNIGDRLGRLEDKQKTMGDRIEAMEPTVASLTELRAKAGGIIVALGVVGTIIGGMLSVFAGELKTWIFRLFGIGG